MQTIAVIGLGVVAEAHLKGYESLTDATVRYAVEPRAERLEEVCNRHEDVQGFLSLDDLLGSARPDIACVLTPVDTHREVVESLAASGIHVLCEKPMALSLEDAYAMKRACESAPVKFLYGSSYRYLPAILRARMLVQAGEIGEMKILKESAIGGNGFAAYHPMSEAHYPIGGPGGGAMGLVDHGIHLFDVIPWIGGSRVATVIGRGDKAGQPPAPEFAMLQLESGIIGQLTYYDCTWNSSLPWEGQFSGSRGDSGQSIWVGDTGYWETSPGCLEVYGTEGAMRIFHYNNRLFVNRAGVWQEERLPDAASPEHFATQMQGFCNALTNGEPPAVGVSEGIAALQVLLAIYESAKTGQWEHVDRQG